MTKENREKQYLHFRNLEKNYEVSNPELDKGLTSVSSMRGRVKANADAMLLRYPALAELDKKEETKPKVKKDGKKSKG